jgi:predicted negative regulator of RcsB-dependent stress response
MAGEANGWTEWSKHVLKELERLNANYENLNNKIDSIKKDIHEEIATIKNEITKIKAMQYSLDELKAWKKTYEDEAVLKTLKELKAWKGDIDEVTSATQLDNYIEVIKELQTFKTQAITIFLVVQAIMGITIALIKLL